MTTGVLWGSMGPDSHSLDSALELAVGKTQSIVHLAQPWASQRLGDPINYVAFPGQYMTKAAAAGALICLNWGSWNLTSQKDPAFSLDAIIAGTHDAFIHTWARAAAAWQGGTRFLLRFDWEMNGDWYLWCHQPATFVQMWRHVHDIFVQEGATNVAWVWCPNVCGLSPTAITAVGQLASYYPGDDVVDWTGLDGYNKVDPSKPSTWLTFTQVFRGFGNWMADSYAAVLAIAPNKPLLVGETNCTDDARKPGWLLEMLAQIPVSLPQVRALMLFNWSSSALGSAASWPLTGASLEAFRIGIQNPVYLPAGVWAPTAGHPAPELPIGQVVAGQAQALQDATAAAAAANRMAADATASQADTQAELDQGRADVAAVIKFGTPAPSVEPAP